MPVPARLARDLDGRNGHRCAAMSVPVMAAALPFIGLQPALVLACSLACRPVPERLAGQVVWLPGCGVAYLGAAAELPLRRYLPL